MQSTAAIFSLEGEQFSVDLRLGSSVARGFLCSPLVSVVRWMRISVEGALARYRVHSVRRGLAHQSKQDSRSFLRRDI